MTKERETLQEWISASDNIVFFGGAGVSTESGIPDFRSADGLYAQRYPHPPETMVSRSFFDAHPREFFDFYCDRMLALRKQSPDGVPRCPRCGTIVKPDVVLYEEPLDDGTVTAAVRAIASADLLVIAGTSLAVYPAAGLIDYFSGDHLAIINRTPTPRDAHADLCIATNVGKVLGY